MKIFSSASIACLAVGVDFSGSLPPAGQTLQLNVIGDRNNQREADLFVFPNVDGGYVKNLKTGQEAVWFDSQLEQKAAQQDQQRVIATAEVINVHLGFLNPRIVITGTFQIKEPQMQTYQFTKGGDYA